MSDVNKVLLMGRLTRDPELRSIPSGMQVAEFGLAMGRQWRSQSGEMQQETTFVDIAVWGRQGENVHKYLTKGRQVFVEGRLKYDSWEGRDGQKRTRLTVVADSVTFIGGRPGEDRGPRDEGAPSRKPPVRGEAPAPAPEPSVQERPPDDNLNLDDVPF
jgi:single-strand DNA-binding protein